jgi:ankyrin repeat protein
MLIAEADMTCSLDTVFNRCMQNVLDGKYGPEDERVCGKSLLWYAAGRGLLPAVKYLVENEADARASADTQQTIVSQAALSGNVELVKYAESKGCDPKATNNWRDSTVIYAPASGSLECVKFLISEGALLMAAS